ncbi:pentraxin fusion protein-like [Lissotriton helveticus]
MYSRMEIILYLLLLARVKSETIYSCQPAPSEINVARHGFARQSSQYKGSPRATAWLAIDGQHTMDFRKSSCTHTDKEKGAWWSLNLGKSYAISAIRIFNRNDCCQKRLLLAEVRVGDSPDIVNQLCGTFTQVNINDPAVFCCKGIKGQYIHVQIPKYAQFLSLCEVEVYPVLETM